MKNINELFGPCCKCGEEGMWRNIFKNYYCSKHFMKKFLTTTLLIAGIVATVIYFS